MEQPTSRYGDNQAQEPALRDYLLIVLGKWWLIAAVFIILVVGARVYSLRSHDVFEARTKLLIVARVSERLVTQQAGTQDRAAAQVNPVLGTSLSVQTLSALATANDLLQQIIAALDLRDQTTGSPWGVESLAGMMQARVETAGPRGSEASLPLLTMTVRGGDPKLLKRIADKWAEVFARQNAQLFATEAARSYEFLAAQQQELRTALRARQDERLTYQKANPLSSLRSQLEVTTARYREFLAQLQANRAALAEAQAKLKYYDAALGEVRRKQAEKAAFQKSNPVETLQSELQVSTERYREFLTTLQRRQAALVEVAARVQSLSAALAAEPKLLRLKRSIPNESLFAVLGGNVSPDRLKALGDLELTDEQPNPRYEALKGQLGDAQIEASTYTAQVRDLQSRTSEIKGKIEQLVARIAEINLTVSTFDDEIAVSQTPVVLTLGSGATSTLTVALATASGNVALLDQTSADLEKRTAQFDSEIRLTSERIAQGELELARFDQDISVLAENASKLAGALREAQIAKEEQAGSIRVVEAAVEPRVPVGPNRRQTVLAAAILGIVLGVGLAFVLHYLKRPQAPPASPQPQAGAPDPKPGD